MGEKLTCEAVLAMPAGREMDALVEARVFGWGGPSEHLFSRDIFAAWLVVRWLAAGRDFVAVVSIEGPANCSAAFSHVHHGTFDARGETEEVAICRAALLVTLKGGAT